MTTIYLTRHAYSCANYNVDLNNRIKAHRKRDPSITMWGIYSTLLLSEKEPFIVTTSTIGIYVSCLIRTWQTAVLLYHKCQTINLIISPFAKEENSIGILNEDNKPNKVENQCVYFLYFLNAVRQYLNCKQITVFIAGEGTIEFILDGEWKLKTEMNTLFDYKPKLPHTRKVHIKTIRTCIDYIPQKIKPAQFEEYKHHLDENIQHCLSKDGIHPIQKLITKPFVSYSPDYLETNPNKFMAWLMTQPTTNNEYRCVLHSKIIRSYLNEHFGIDKKTNPCSNQNTWTLKLTLTANKYIEDGVLYEGIPKPNPKLLTHENEIICNQGLGGKNKTKKNKKNRYK
jgi:hypothetical protein